MSTEPRKHLVMTVSGNAKKFAAVLSMLGFAPSDDRNVWRAPLDTLATKKGRLGKAANAILVKLREGGCVIHYTREPIGGGLR